jgi:hypothetical protein
VSFGVPFAKGFIDRTAISSVLIDAPYPSNRVDAAPAVAILMTLTALPITSAGRFSPLGPRGMFYRRGNL